MRRFVEYINQYPEEQKNWKLCGGQYPFVQIESLCSQTKVESVKELITQMTKPLNRCAYTIWWDLYSPRVESECRQWEGGWFTPIIMLYLRDREWQLLDKGKDQLDELTVANDRYSSHLDGTMSEYEDDSDDDTKSWGSNPFCSKAASDHHSMWHTKRHECPESPTESERESTWKMFAFKKETQNEKDEKDGSGEDENDGSGEGGNMMDGIEKDVIEG